MLGSAQPTLPKLMCGSSSSSQKKQSTSQLLSTCLVCVLQMVGMELATSVPLQVVGLLTLPAAQLKSICQFVRCAFAGVEISRFHFSVEGPKINEVITDFVQGATAMQAYVCQKLQCWDVLPWKLCGISHSNPLAAEGVDSGLLGQGWFFMPKQVGPAAATSSSPEHHIQGSPTRLAAHAY